MQKHASFGPREKEVWPLPTSQLMGNKNRLAAVTEVSTKSVAMMVAVAMTEGRGMEKRGGACRMHQGGTSRERHLDNLVWVFRGGEGGLAGGVVAQVGFTKEP